ncbi:hypothetical protein HRR83_001180 [Exophiala dermatitidis]|uniref:Uncharacterized protein n=2 Tax=Exophiala dermatitidis TaxID=5970 RepID=H6C747_EXODN|nr:uncharacterized protein HMPREF1120_07531 [Exophiala dermatitidis NIH/UT8656]KAJ4522690.1 hypothetical protein HRR75_001084 [Exophiala dermatitidis]EHY59543.1 hypothetical protein HMPREF1120_07531 [Exophiala dermatitidis NIH/UT8656]KAJ4525991.1 hypothetical protein HRR74_001184 [Exophiala dermatitidis]KAJ4527063.1 hypothetical protein HRR73_001860 [Exophiala dermatitidis]KAJ4532781.1 hypothetical protein HRR76_007762 [Exophiala dermatitidis]
MPFASLRRRSTTAERSEPQADEPNKPPVNRGRSITLPSISSRKSFSSLIASSMRGRSTTPSPRKSEADSLEGELYPTYDASDHDNEPHRASRPPSAEKPRRFRRAPSPHPLKGSKTSTSSRLPKKNRNMLNRARSHSSLTDSSPTKSFLHTLADALKTPTALFSNNYKHRSSFDTDDTSENSPIHSGESSPRKSVRFRPGTSIIGLQPKSAPIDIPKTTPALPPVRLATTPLQQCLKGDQSDLVPTARPTETPILKSSATFRQAIATTDPVDILKDFQGNERISDPADIMGLPTPFPGTIVAIDNPFEDPIDLDDPELIRNMLQEYDGSFTSRTPQSRQHQESFGDYNVPSLETSNQGASDSTSEDIKQECNGRLVCPDVEPRQTKQATLASVTAEESDLHTRDGTGLEETPASSAAGISQGAVPCHSTQEQGKESKIGVLARTNIHEEGTGSRSSMSSESVTSTHGGVTWTAELALRKHRRDETTELGTTTSGLQDPQKMSSGIAQSAVVNPRTDDLLAKSEKLYPPRAEAPCFHPAEELAKLSDTGIERFTPSPCSVALPISVQPESRHVPREYSDQFGWSPFDDYEFQFATLAFIDDSEDEFRHLVCQRGGLWIFWHWCDLPQETAPSQRTRGLVSWEIDDILCIVRQQNRVPRSVYSDMIEAFKYRTRLAFVGKQASLGETVPLRTSISTHESEDTEESFDNGSMTHELEAVVDDEGYEGSLSANHDSEPASSLNQSWVKRWSPSWSSKLGMQMGYGETSKPGEGLKSFKYRLWSPFGPTVDVAQANTACVVDERAPFSYGLWKPPSSLNSSDGDATMCRGQHLSKITTEGRLSSPAGQLRANCSKQTAANHVHSVQLE